MQLLTRSMHARWAIVLSLTACLWVANPDITDAHQITDGAYDNAFPAWSPDGTKLAFASTRTDFGES